MQFIVLKRQQERLREGLEKSYIDILNHGRYIMGPEIYELEKKLSESTGAKHVISCANGTDALTMALMALGIGVGDAIFTTAFSFFATIETGLLVGATPVFVDIERQTFNLNPSKLEKAIKKLLLKQS